MTNKIDFTKPLQTRSGLKVRILSTAFEFEQHVGNRQIVVELQNYGYSTYDKDGKYYSSTSEDHYLDLQNIPEETFEQKVERFKKSEFYVSDKRFDGLQFEVVTWDKVRGFYIFGGFEAAMHWIDFK